MHQGSKIAPRPVGGRSGLSFTAAALLAASGALALSAPAQAQLMAPSQSMTQSGGVGQGQRVAPMSGTSRMGLADQMGHGTPTGETQAVAAAPVAAPPVEPRAERTGRSQRQGVVRASSSRQNLDAISEFNRIEGALLVKNSSGIREIAQLRGSTICFPVPADQAEAAKFLGGRAVSYTAVTADGPPAFLVDTFNRGGCQAIYMSRQTQQMMANISMPDALVLTR